MYIVHAAYTRIYITYVKVLIRIRIQEICTAYRSNKSAI